MCIENQNFSDMAKSSGTVEKNELQRSMLKKGNNKEEGDYASFLRPHAQKVKIANLFI